MWALRKLKAAPGAVPEELPDPIPGPGEVRVRVRRASICGTDLHLYRWNGWASSRVSLPLTLGHECAGVVDALGPGAAGLRPGDRVALESHVVCGRCPACLEGQGHACSRGRILGVDRDGVFAEAVVVPATNCWPVPDGVPWDLASLLEPFGNAVHTALAVPLVGQVILVTGAGFTGLGAVAVAKAAGARRVVAVEPLATRRELAAAMGADAVLDPGDPDLAAQLRRLVGEDGADAGLEMSGAPEALRTCLRHTRSGGQVAVLGLPAAPVHLPLAEEVVLRGITLKGIVGRRLWHTWRVASALVASGRVDLAPAVTARLSLADWSEGYRRAMAGEGKVIFSLGEDGPEG